MAQRPSVVTAEVTSVPDPTEIARVADFVREPFVEDGEDAAAVLAPGSIRRHAFEAARTELNAGAEVPSQKWRRRWSLLLGLDRTLNATTPVLADGTTLNPHQIDALSGTYAALLADAQRRASGGSGSDGDALLLSFEDEDPTELDDPPTEVATADDDEGHHEDGASSDDEDGEDDDLESLDEQLVELPDAEPESESSLYDDVADEDIDEDIDRVALDDPNAHKRFWFEHATGAGKTVAAMGFVEACRTGGILILTHRRNLVDQFQDELRTRGYGERLSKPLLTDADGNDPNPDLLGPVTIETYQWFVRNAGRISGAYTVVICDEAHTALGDKTSAAIRAWTGPIFIGMTATGALIARHVADLFPTQTSRFDLAQAARRGVIAPLRCLRIPPGPGVRTIAKVPLRKGEVDMEFDQEELAKLLDQAPFNLAIADLYKTRFRNTPGVVYTAGVEHAYNVAESFRALGMKAQAVSGETPKRELANILAEYDAGNIDVLINAQLLAEGWNSPRATICMHLAPTASKRIYQQRVGRVTRRHPGKEAGVVIDFVHPATPNDDPVVTLHSLLDRDVYRGGAIVVGPVRRGRGRRVKVERRVLPVTPDIERRRQVFERELWRIAVEQLDWGEQRVWAALAGAKASPSNWRRGRAMLNFDRSGELRRQFLITALERNRNQPLRMRAIQEIALLREAEPFDTAIDFIGQWPRDERREASRTMLQAMADRRIGRRDQATAWIWRLAEYTRDVHEEYAAQRWPATKHLLGLLVNSSGAAHARNARRLVHGARQHDRRLQAALLAAAVAHTPEAEEVLREARTRLARKPGALSRDLLKDFPNGKRRKKRTRKRRGGNGAANGEEATNVATDGTTTDIEAADNGATEENGNGGNGNGNGGSSRSRRGRSRGGRRRNRGGTANAEATSPGESAPQGEGTPQDDGIPQGEAAADVGPAPSDANPVPAPEPDVSAASDEAPPTRRRVRGQKAAELASATPEAGDATSSTDASTDAEPTDEAVAEPKPAPRRTRTRTRTTAAERAAEAEAAAAPVTEAPAAAPVETAAPAEPPAEATSDEKPARRTRTRKTAAEKAAEAEAAAAPAVDAASAQADDAPAATKKPAARRTTTRKTAAQKAAEAEAAAAPAVDTASPAANDTPAATKKPAARRTTTRKTAAQKAAEAEAAAAPAVDTASPAANDTPAATKKPAARRTTTRKTAAQKAAEAEAAAAPAVDTASPAANDAPAATKKPAARRTTTRKTAAQKAAEAEAAAAPAVDTASPAANDTPAATKKPAARRTTTRKTAAQKAAEAEATATDAPEAAPAAKPAARKPTTRKTAAQKAAEAAATDGVEDAPTTKPAARRATTPVKAATAAKTSTAAAPKKPATRKTAAQKAAEAAAETATDAPAKKPVARKTTTRKPAAAKATTTAAKKPAAAKPTTTARTTAAAKKPAAAKATAPKTPAARKATARGQAAPTPEEDESRSL